ARPGRKAGRARGGGGTLPGVTPNQTPAWARGGAGPATAPAAAPACRSRRLVSPELTGERWFISTQSSKFRRGCSGAAEHVLRPEIELDVIPRVVLRGGQEGIGRATVQRAQRRFRRHPESRVRIVVEHHRFALERAIAIE